MKSFKFDKNEAKMLELEIEGIKFSFNPKSATVIEACKKFNTRQTPLNKILDNKEKLDEKKINETVVKSCLIVRDTLNAILGKKAYERIFANRTADFDEHMSLMCFIFNEITKFVNPNHEYTH